METTKHHDAKTLINASGRAAKKIVGGDSRLSEIIRFAMTGGMATVLQYGIYVVFVEAVHVPPVVSTLISYGISFIFNFILSTYFTFKTRPNRRNMLGFVLSHLINMGLQTGFVAIFALIVPKSIALLPALGICIPCNYLMVRYAFKGKFATRHT